MTDHRVYIVTGKTGSNEDVQNWDVKAYLNRALAYQHCRALNDWADRHGLLHLPGSVPDQYMDKYPLSPEVISASRWNVMAEEQRANRKKNADAGPGDADPDFRVEDGYVDYGVEEVSLNIGK